MLRIARLCSLAVPLAIAGCNGVLDPEPVRPATMACPDAVPGQLVLNKQFAPSGPADAKLRSFVQATNDLAGAANQTEVEIAQACTRIGADLGVPSTAMGPRQENGGRATGACFPAGQALDGILRQGAQVFVRVTPPLCTQNILAQSQCANVCNVSPGDAECAASCRAHGDIYATCTPPLMVVTPSNANPLSFRLAGTLQANLPSLLHAELTLGRRLAPTSQMLSQVGANLRGLVSGSGGLAIGCANAGASEVSMASWQLQVSVRASSEITHRIGATNG